MILEHILNDIEMAKNNHAYISALSLSLTLPNILSNIEYGKETFKNEYIQWFDDWVYKYYEHPKSENEVINRGIEATKFDGNACYLLRCALLHSGNTDLKDSKGCRKIDWFQLCISDISPHCGDAYVCDVSSEKAHNVWVSINVIGLIDSLISGAKEYIELNKDKVLKHQNSDINCRTFGSIRIKEK